MQNFVTLFTTDYLAFILIFKTIALKFSLDYWVFGALLHFVPSLALSHSQLSHPWLNLRIIWKVLKKYRYSGLSFRQSYLISHKVKPKSRTCNSGHEPLIRTSKCWPRVRDCRDTQSRLQDSQRGEINWVRVTCQDSKRGHQKTLAAERWHSLGSWEKLYNGAGI